MGVKKKAKAASGERGRAGDPDRSTALLWRRRKASGAPPKAGLSLDRVVRAAVELADAEGLSAVSMRRIAERLGFTTMSLYRHVPGKEELTDLMREAVLGEVSPPEPGTRPWRAALDAWARAGSAVHARHPWLAFLGGTRRVPGPNAVAHYESALRALASTSLGPAQIVAAVGFLGTFVEGAARQAAETARMEEATGVGEAEWWGARGALFEKLDGYPTLESIWRSGGYERPEDPFEFGLERVLDGLHALMQKRRPPKRRSSRQATSGR